MGSSVFLVINGKLREKEKPQQQNTPDTSNQTTLIPTNQDQANKNIFTWPQINLNNTVLFTSQKYILGKATPDGKNVQPLNQELTEKYNFVQTWVSPDHSKLLFVLFANPPKDSDQYNYSLASLDGKVIKKIDVQAIKKVLGEKVENLR